MRSIQNDFLRVQVSEHGAELQSIRDAGGTEYLWQGDPAYWPDRAPNLFPYVARLTDGTYSMDGQLHHMKIHGFAPYLNFAVRQCENTRLVMELAPTPETRSAYPRDFRFRVIYELLGSGLSVTYEVENRDRKSMYFGLGAHPGFRVPLREGRRFEDYRLRFSPDCRPRRIGFTDDCFLDGTDSAFPLDSENCLALRHDLFDQDAIVLRSAGHQVVLEAPDDPVSVTLEFPGMDYLGLWHVPRTDAPYVCIEPWCSLPSAKGKIAVFEEQADLIPLAVGETYRNTWRIRTGQL